MPADGYRNVILITTDQHRADALGSAGHPDVRTPHLDALAARSVAFDRVYTTNPVCMPSRATLLTGQFPDAHGVRRNGVEVPDRPWGVARVFREHGRRTGMFGKTHFGSLRRDYDPGFRPHTYRVGPDYFGFEHRAITHDLKDYRPSSPGPAGPLDGYSLDDYADWMREQAPELYELALRDGRRVDAAPLAPELWTSALPPHVHQSAWITDRAMDWMADVAAEPFFAWVSYVDPHHPFTAPAPYRAQYDPDALAPPLWSPNELARRSPYHQERHALEWPAWEEHWREYRAQYYGMISLIDDQVGRLLDHLAALGIADDTAVVFTSDHGELLGDHGLARKGLFHYESLIRVPLLVRAPGAGAAGTRQRGIAQTVDVPTTLLDLAGIPSPPEHQGVSLLPWCRGERSDSPRPYALVTNGGEGPQYDPWPELRTLVTDRWKLNLYQPGGWTELDDLRDAPDELHPAAPEDHAPLVRELLTHLADASSRASVWGHHVGRW